MHGLGKGPDALSTAHIPARRTRCEPRNRRFPNRPVCLTTASTRSRRRFGLPLAPPICGTARDPPGRRLALVEADVMRPNVFDSDRYREGEASAEPRAGFNRSDRPSTSRERKRVGRLFDRPDECPSDESALGRARLLPSLVPGSTDPIDPTKAQLGGRGSCRASCRVRPIRRKRNWAGEAVASNIVFTRLRFIEMLRIPNEFRPGGPTDCSRQ